LVETIRSFIAFDIDDPTIFARISAVQTQLSATGADISIVRPENIHLTLRFLGDITRDMANQIGEEMKNLKYKPFEVELNGVGAFSNLRNIRVVWIGITRGESELKAIHGQLEPKLEALGFTPDRKGFSPHLTIARVRSGRNKIQLADCIKTLSDHEFGTIKVATIKLEKSTLTPKGPIYETLHEFTPANL